MTNRRPPPGGIRAALDAWRLRRAFRSNVAPALVVEMRGGAAAFVRRRDAKRLVTTVSAEAVGEPSRGVMGWLERRQARRSALLVVPDRATGVAVALRWGLNPERFRLAGAFDPATARNTQGDPRPAAWHSTE